MSDESNKGALKFALTETQQKALAEIAGSRQVRLSGKVVAGHFQVDFVACNAAFVACNAAFTACNSAFKE